MFCDVCIIDNVKAPPERLWIVPALCCMPPFSGSCPLPVPPAFTEAVTVGDIMTLPATSIDTDAAMFMSRLRTIGLELTVRLGLKLIVAVIGPGTFFCTIWPVTGDIYVTRADEIVIVAPEYVPCATLLSEIGSVVPMRCIISSVVGVETTGTEPPAALDRVIEPIVMLTATSWSDGPSPIFTCNAVVLG